MKMESAQKKLAYQESVWKVKEIDFIEDKRKLELRIGMFPMHTSSDCSAAGTGIGVTSKRSSGGIPASQCKSAFRLMNNLAEQGRQHARTDENAC
jgi:hypothetical protein